MAPGLVRGHRRDRPLVDDDALLERDPAQPACKSSRLDGRGARHEGAGPEHRRPDALGNVGRGERPPAIALAEARTGLGRLQPSVILGRSRADLDEAALDEPSVDPVLSRPRSERADRRVEGTRRPQRLDFAELVDQARQLVPPAGDEPAVAPGRPRAAQVLLDHDDRGRGLELADPERRPEAGVAAAEDRHVEPGTTGERRRRDVGRQRVRLGGERLAQPERAAATGPHAVERVVRC